MSQASYNTETPGAGFQAPYTIQTSKGGLPVYTPRGFDPQDTPLARLQLRVCDHDRKLEEQKDDIENLESVVKDNDSNVEHYILGLQARAGALEEALGDMKVLMEATKADNDDLRRHMVALEANESRREPRRSVRLMEARG